MNSLNQKTAIYIFNFLLFICVSACGQSKYDYNYKTSNAEVIAINNNAVNIFFKISSGKKELKDSLPKVEKDLRQAIQLDTNYKLSYINLINCIVASKNVRPFERAPEYFGKLINVCNSWLNMHDDDMDMRLKRGVFYERAGDTTMSNKDYAILEKYLEGLNIIVEKKMNSEQISEVINYAFLFVTVRKPKKGFELIDQLNSYYPNNPSVISSYTAIHKRKREEQIYQFQY